MAITIPVPVSTAVIEENSDCLRGGHFENGAIVIDLDARRQKHHAILGLPKRTKLHWSKEPRTYEVQELSSFLWPIRYRVTVTDHVK